MRHPAGAAVRAVLAVPALRSALRRTPGLRFWRVLGSGRGEAMSLSIDPRRWAVFAVWASPDDLDRFLASSPAVRRWEAAGAEAWHGRLELRQARGSWGGVRLLPAARPAAEAGGPAAFLTRAAIRPRRLRSFHAAVRAVEADLLSSEGRLRSVGVGEWPVAQQATFSLWRSQADGLAFAYSRPRHAAVVRRTRAEGWYTEDLFARFGVRTLRGTWDGADPLA